MSRSSIDWYLHDTTTPIEAAPGKVASPVASAPGRPVALDEPSTMGEASALELKAKLDVMREAVAAERARSRRLIGIARDLLDELAAGIDDADRLDSVTSGYSDALTQLLITDPPPASE